MTDEIIANASVENEELTRKTIDAIQRAKASLDRGEGIPQEEILHEFSYGILLASNQQHDR